MSWHYVKKSFRIYVFNFFSWINKHILKTYPLIQDCARCRDCGRNVHDFHVSNELWMKIIEKEDGVWCYDCFCNRADEKNLRNFMLEIKEYNET